MMSRDPNGKFIGKEAMLHYWLPLMLSWVHREPLVAMLERAAYWCTMESAKEMELNANYLKEYPDVRDWWLNPIKRVEQWRQRREILLEAMDKLRAIK